MKKLLIILCAMISSLYALTNAEIELILKHELWDIAKVYEADIQSVCKRQKAFIPAWQIMEELARLEKDTLKMIRISTQKSLALNTMTDAINAISLADAVKLKNKKALTDSLKSQFKKKINLDLLDYYQSNSEKTKKTMLKNYQHYSVYMEEWAKEEIDKIATETNEETRLSLINHFFKTYPNSRYVPVANHYLLITYRNQKKFNTFYKRVLYLLKKKKSVETKYLIAFHSIDPKFRRSYYEGQANVLLLNQAERNLNEALSLIKNHPKTMHYYVSLVSWNQEMMISKIHLEIAKINYYRVLMQAKYYGDEENDDYRSEKSSKAFEKALTHIQKTQFKNNNNGELATYHFWYAKILRTSNDSQYTDQTVQHLIDCLILSAPRNPYEKQCKFYLSQCMKIKGIETDLMTWVREIKEYKEPIFADISESSGLKEIKAGRVAWGDFDNDTYDDLLIDGNLILKNMKNNRFEIVSDSMSNIRKGNNGGLWADFNKDGKLDFVTINSGENGENLYIQKEDHFVNLSDRAGSVDTKSPTEGVAWIDVEGKGYPSLYFANYETWGKKSAYPDHFFENQNGYLTDKTKENGFVSKWYPELAGRGVAPADFDNDGETEILVTNYRLNRNLLFDKKGLKWEEIAGLSQLNGVNKDGYYGHSIGADWGDYDNDGDLDVFIANLAHPRYIDFSDISCLMRNDGKKTIKIDTIQIELTQFANMTPESGIQFDETHSDPMWFDADNDGDLDLYISSIYPNERSYLYLNEGDGTFKDITFLSGIRSYNAWGNASADINHDGRLDVVVASSEGVRLFLNTTQNENKGIVFKAVWTDSKIRFFKDYQWKDQANSPAYGARVVLYYYTENGQLKNQIRELQSAKGTTSQNSQTLHFGYGRIKPAYAELWFKNQMLDKISFIRKWR